MTDSNITSDLLKTIQCFQIVKCNMHHEKVATDANGDPLYQIQNDELFFDRVHLCDPKLRKLRLGCAHSGVNINFERFLERLVTAFPQKTNQILDFKTEFKTVVSKIYEIDHKVGNLEHELAVLQLTSNDTNKEPLLKTMSSFKLEHRTLMDCLSRIKSDIEQLIISEGNYDAL